MIPILPAQWKKRSARDTSKMSHQSKLISTDINAYLAQHERKELLRLLTCGSVDDGKSTLIGRLLYDSKSIYMHNYPPAFLMHKIKIQHKS
mgnify:CR=1 FL=1